MPATLVGERSRPNALCRSQVPPFCMNRHAAAKHMLGHLAVLPPRPIGPRLIRPVI